MNSDFRKRVVFPAVTVCNINRLRVSQLGGTAYQSIEDMDYDMEYDGIMSEIEESSDYLYNDGSDVIDYPDTDISIQENVQTQSFKVSA